MLNPALPPECFDDSSSIDRRGGITDGAHHRLPITRRSARPYGRPAKEGSTVNEIDLNAFRELIEEGIPFNRFLGLKLLHLGERQCRLLLPFREELVGDSRRKALHGGVISTLIDTCGGFAVWSAGSIGDRISTIDLRVDYLKPAAGTDIVAESRVKLLGNRVGNVHTVVWAVDEPEAVLAEGRSVYNIRRS